MQSKYKKINFGQFAFGKKKRSPNFSPTIHSLSVLNSLSAANHLLILIEFEFLNKANKYIMNLKLPLIIQSFLAVSSCHVIKKLNMDVIKAFFGSTTYKSTTCTLTNIST